MHYFYSTFYVCVKGCVRNLSRAPKHFLKYFRMLPKYFLSETFISWKYFLLRKYFRKYFLKHVRGASVKLYITISESIVCTLRKFKLFLFVLFQSTLLENVKTEHTKLLYTWFIRCRAHDFEQVKMNIYFWYISKYWT